ncbi:MAG TPA: ATP-binding protein [Motiliproteus sp.]
MGADTRQPPTKPAIPDPLQLDSATEAAWVDVVHQMEEVYSDLIHYQVEIEQKNAELEDAQQFIASVLTSMTDVLIVCDSQGRIQQTNQALEEIVGLPERALIGRPFVELFTAESRDEIHVKQCSGPLELVDCVVELLTAHEPVPLSMNCNRRFDARGRSLGQVLIGRPIGELRRAYDELNRSHAELKRAQQQLIDSEKMASLGRLVAGVAHELNNPISFIYGNVHALSGYSERLRRYLELLHQNPQGAELEQLRQQLRIDKLLQDLPSLMAGTMEGAERVRDIVMDLRQFSSGQKQHHEEFDLVHVVQTAVQWVTRDAPIKLRIGYDLPRSLPISGHPGQIQQVLINLVQNAVDAMAAVESPRLNLSINRSGERMIFRIRDNGPGIADDHLSKLFEPFFTTKPVGQGTGLGLSLSYGLVAEHGGRLSAANDPRGGAVFTMELPCRAVTPEIGDV